MSFSDKKFGRLTIISSPRPDVYKCRCECGNEIAVWRSQLANNVVRHCGCRDTRQPGYQISNPHRLAHYRVFIKSNGKQKKFISGELNSYLAMIARCYRENKQGEYTCETHGGKGIRVCDRWLEPNGQGFRNFLADMGPRPSCTSLDRVNPQDHYTPLNCRWGTPKEQGFHKTHIMWKDQAAPPIPSIRDANEQIDNIFGHEPY